MDVLQKENNDLKALVIELQTKLKEYTCGERHKRYYKEHKQDVIKKANARLEKLKEKDPEKLKEYRRRAYQKQKEKRQKQETKLLTPLNI